MPKTVLITGGSSGVGAELVKVFTERGYLVWFTYNSGRSRADSLLLSLPRGSMAMVSLSALQLPGGNQLHRCFAYIISECMSEQLQVQLTQ